MTTRATRGLVVVALVALGCFLTADNVLNANLGLPRSNGAWDVFYQVTFLIGAPTFAVAGALIVMRQPRNTIGWLLLAVPLLTAFAFMVGNYATYTLVSAPGALPFGRAAAWVDRWAIIPTLCLLSPLFLLFPDGHVPSPRWRPVLWLVIAAPAVTMLAFALTPGRMTGAFAQLTEVRVVNPFGIRAAGRAIQALSTIGGFSSALAAFTAGGALVARFRGRRGDERQQVKWLAFVGAAFLIELALAAVLGIALGNSGAGDAIGNVMFALMFLTLGFGIPIACAVAILKHRLYDLDIVVRKTLVVGALAVFVTVVYAVIVAGIGTAVGARSSTLLSFVAAVALAVLFQPARDRARRLADRLIYGRRATPYEVLSEFSEHVAGAYSTEDVLPRMARLLAEGTGASEARVWLRVGADLVPAASFPDSNGASPPVVGAVSGGSLAPPNHDPAFPVLHRGEMLGAVTVEMPPSDPLTPPKEKLIRDFASQAGHVLRNVRLVEDLKASRTRLAAAQDSERRTLERNIHDGAQQQLVALAVKTKLAAGIAKSRGARRTEELLEQVRTEAQRALEDLRDVARGIYPPLLADKGLAAALDAQARKSSIPVTIHDDGAIGRYPQEIESAVYFCALEALRNVAEHAGATRAGVRLLASQGELRFEAADDGRGFDPAVTGNGTGLQGMADRLDALGGTLSVRSAPGAGTTVEGRLPVGPTEPVG